MSRCEAEVVMSSNSIEADWVNTFCIAETWYFNIAENENNTDRAKLLCSNSLQHSESQYFFCGHTIRGQTNTC